MKYLLITILSFITFCTFAQVEKPDKLKTDTVPTLKLTVEQRKEEEVKKQKKMKKNVFYGKKCRKLFTRTGEGNRETIEIFFVLKTYEVPNPYVKDVYWYDMTKQRIVSTRITEKELPYAQILHGPYKKMIGGQVIEEGVFYVGTKHARWEKYDKDFILIDKVKYNKGWAKEAEITYFDSDRKKVNEVIPKVGEVLEGEYFAYYPSGNIKMQGKYKNGVKIGLWFEYHDAAYKKKKEIKYPHSYLDKTTPPVLLKEWDIKGKVIFDKVVEDRLQKLKPKDAIQPQDTIDDNDSTDVMK